MIATWEDMVCCMEGKGYKLLEDGKKGFKFRKQRGTQKHNYAEVFFKTTGEMFSLLNNKEFMGGLE